MQIKTDKTIILEGDQSRATLTIAVSDCEKCIDELASMISETIAEYKKRKKSKPCGGCGGAEHVS